MGIRKEGVYSVEGEGTPVYPTPLEAFQEFASHVTRGPLITTGIVYALYPAYTGLTAYLSGLGLEDAWVFALPMALTHTMTYLVVNGFFHYCDTTGTMEQYKLWRSPIMKNPWERFTHMWTEAFIGQLLAPFLLYMLWHTVAKDLFLRHDDPLGEWHGVFLAVAAAKLWNTVFFYWAHRLLHHEKLYARFHKQHHAFQGTVGFAAEYASPLEQVFANYIPTLGGMLLLYPVHPLTMCVWLGTRLQQTFESHSGYSFRNTWAHKIGMLGSDATIFHDYHHTVNNGNYAVQWIDYLFGTMEPFARGGGYEGYLSRKEKRA